MKTVPALLSILFSLNLACHAREPAPAGPNGATKDADNIKKLIVGKWKVTQAAAGTLAIGDKFEFAPDGKLKIAAYETGGELILDATYTVDGDSFTYNFSFNGKDWSRKFTIQEIDDHLLETTDSDNRIINMKRVTGGSAAAANNKKLLAGKWEVTKADPGTTSVGGKLEFAPDGKFKTEANENGKELM